MKMLGDISGRLYLKVSPTVDWIQTEASRTTATSPSPDDLPEFETRQDRLTQDRSSSCKAFAGNRNIESSDVKQIRAGQRKSVKMVARSRSTCHYSTSMEVWAKTVNYRTSQANGDDSWVPIPEVFKEERERKRGESGRRRRNRLGTVADRSLERKRKIGRAQSAN